MTLLILTPHKGCSPASILSFSQYRDAITKYAILEINFKGIKTKENTMRQLIVSDNLKNI